MAACAAARLPLPCCPFSPSPHPLASPSNRAPAEEDERWDASPSLGSIVAVLAPPTGGVWVAHKGGAIDRYTASGRRLGAEEAGASVTAAACVGQRVWLGFSDGMVRCAGSAMQPRASTDPSCELLSWLAGRRPLNCASLLPLRCSVRDAEGASLRVFQAHSAGILSIAQAGTRTYTLAADGSIAGWSSAVSHAADTDAL